MDQITSYNALVGYYLEAQRKSMGWDQAKLSEKTGISQPVLSRLEKGKSSITADQLFVICRALGIHPSELLKKAESGVDAIDANDNVEVKTTKDASSSGGTLLAGAAIGAVLALLLSRK